MTMRDAFTAIFCTLVIAAGWYYLARSQGVQRLQGFESPRRNTTRRRARRMGAWSMILIGASGFWLMWEVQHAEDAKVTSPARAFAALVLVSFSLVTMMVCATVDVYLTMRMRRTNGRPK